jgi:imidazole glycerol-phosphate synthase subunit HisH
VGNHIVIVDYGMGNLLSVKRKLERLKHSVSVSSNKEEITAADKLILPGVGHFGKAMENLKKLELIDVLNDFVHVQKKPILGICLGMQLMAKHSEEGNVAGLGWFDADVVRFQVNDTLKHKIPHIGWNDIIPLKESKLIEGIKENSSFYFVHSYHFHLNNPTDGLTSTNYEYDFVSAIERENIFGVQFHPEKSHDIGNVMLENFAKM